MLTNHREEVSPREWASWNREDENLKLQIAHAQSMKDKDIELQRLEMKWSTWLRLPLVLITLPVRILFAIAYIVCMIRKHEPSENFWKFIK